MAQVYKTKSAFQNVQVDKLFWGPWLRWQALTVSERFVCVNIVLLPVWWVLGLYFYMGVLLLLGVALYELWRYGELRLKRPSLPVVALFAFGLYLVVKRFIIFSGILGDLEDTVLLVLCPACWLWYIQSNNIRIRLEVVAWAFTVSVIQMLGLWFAVEFFVPETVLFPARPTLLGLLTGKGAGDIGFSIDHLVPYVPKNLFEEEQNRFAMFFLFPEFCGLVVGCIGIVALDLKNRVWSWLLILACAFLIFLSATRAVWVAFPIVVVLHYLVKFAKLSGPPIILTLMAVASFTILSVPPATNLVLDKFTNSVQAVNDVRKGSSETRLEVYRQTWEGIQEKPLWGYGEKGEVAAGKDAEVGSHSAILGSLLYEKGLVGTLLFTFFWISLLMWFYQTRVGRPLTCFCVWMLYTLVSPTMALVFTMPMSSLLVVLSATIRHPRFKSV